MSSDEQKWWLAPPGMPPEGPFSISEIRSRVESGPEGTDWQVCKEGSDQWHPLTGLPDFAPTAHRAELWGLRARREVEWVSRAGGGS